MQQSLGLFSGDEVSGPWNGADPCVWDVGEELCQFGRADARALRAAHQQCRYAQLAGGVSQRRRSGKDVVDELSAHDPIVGGLYGGGDAGYVVTCPGWIGSGNDVDQCQSRDAGLVVGRREEGREPAEGCPGDHEPRDA